MRWPGRCEIITTEKLPNVNLFIDGAHTPESIKVAIDWWNGSIKAHNSSSSFLLFSCSSDRNSKYQLFDLVLANSDVSFDKIFSIDNSALLPLQFDKSSLYHNDNDIVMSNEKVHQIVKPAHILPTLQRIIPSGSNLLVIGSLYLVGAIFDILNIPTSDLRKA